MKLNTTDLQELKTKKSGKIIAHAVATVELYNNTPKAIHYYFDADKLFVDFEVAARNGSTRNLKYFCYNAAELEEVTSTLASKYNIPVIEDTL